MRDKRKPKRRMTQEELQAIIDRDKPGFRILSDQEINEHHEIERARSRIVALLAIEKPEWSLIANADISIEDVKTNNFVVAVENKHKRTLTIIISNDKIIAEQG
ncbi:MAG: hypothetical protein A3A97_00295 [Candidatus Terrybacteria bacterium RIFCSPLOWO2_01_FULL_40_23]|uniref:Uncharacterized protein n=1 Tax=Candidatus Terrybacteria bacterium RIFCSPLOWO2_01_FULL_40_23 TaxID=1802366 RepID=A0A1G2PRS4_9BACT|nr:MAG: hypothetical protein A3A97_00295 [Candidatus Terrybacteria bacterium RIFCSPLOWO2_01_FULL_40_23]